MTEFNPPKGMGFQPGKKVDVTTVKRETGKVKYWAFTSLMNFEECPYRIYLKSIRKVQGEQSDAANRGNEIHDLAEQYVRNPNGPIPKELAKFEDDFAVLVEAFKEGKVELEEKWGITQSWEQCTWEQYDILWGRIKLDAFHRETETFARCIDYKTGKKFGNELKHGLQGMVYMIAAFARYPELETIKVEFWYLDKGERLERVFTRSQAEVLKQRIHNRALAMTTAHHFPPNPSKSTCKYCSYREVCEYVEK